MQSVPRSTKCRQADRHHVHDLLRSMQRMNLKRGDRPRYWQQQGTMRMETGVLENKPEADGSADAQVESLPPASSDGTERDDAPGVLRRRTKSGGAQSFAPRTDRRRYLCKKARCQRLHERHCFVNRMRREHLGLPTPGALRGKESAQPVLVPGPGRGLSARLRLQRNTASDRRLGSAPPGAHLRRRVDRLPADARVKAWGTFC
jgi:hypothetical protein